MTNNLTKYTGKVVLYIEEFDSINSEPCITINFTDGSKVSIIGIEDFHEYMGLEVIEGRWDSRNLSEIKVTKIKLTD